MDTSIRPKGILDFLLQQEIRQLSDPQNTGIKNVRKFRRKMGDTFYYNWMLHIDQDYQQPFSPTHSAMSSMKLHSEQLQHELASSLRKIFHGIVSGISSKKFTFH